MLTRLVNRVVLGFLGGAVRLVSAILLLVPGGPQVTAELSLLDLFGYAGLFVSVVLVLRVIAAAIRDERGGAS